LPLYGTSRPPRSLHTILPPPPPSTLFPYTTLFRSLQCPALWAGNPPGRKPSLSGRCRSECLDAASVLSLHPSAGCRIHAPLLRAVYDAAPARTALPPRTRHALRLHTTAHATGPPGGNARAIRALFCPRCSAV